MSNCWFSVNYYKLTAFWKDEAIMHSTEHPPRKIQLHETCVVGCDVQSSFLLVAIAKVKCHVTPSEHWVNFEPSGLDGCLQIEFQGSNGLQDVFAEVLVDHSGYFGRLVWVKVYVQK